MRKNYKGHKLNDSHKSQAALEFLTTYGWAFLVILIMIGTLAYFGLLKPSKILPDRCSFGPEFECLDFQVSATDNTFKIRLKNNVGEPVVVNSFTESSETATQYSCTDPTNIGTANVWPAGEVRDFTFTSCNSAAAGFVIGEKGKVLLRLNYHSVRSGSAYAHDSNGEVFSTIV